MGRCDSVLHLPRRHGKNSPSSPQAAREPAPRVMEQFATRPASRGGYVKKKLFFRQKKPFFQMRQKKPFFHCMLAVRGWKMQPLQWFGSFGAQKCNPSCFFQALGLEIATPPTVLKALGWKIQTLLLFQTPGAGKCNPSCCFEGLGLENATHPPVFNAWD